MSVESVIRVRALPLLVHDADSYLLLLDLHGRGLTENGCVSEWVRLRDFSGRELSDTAAEDPLGLGRVNGPTARTLAAKALNGAQEVMVELVGPAEPSHAVTGESLGRFLAWLWVDGVPLGPKLAGEHAVAGGAYVGGGSL